MPVRSPLVSRIFSWLYHLLVLAALLMSILEITRLALSDSGIGLLPFTLAGILLAMVLLGMRRRGTRKPRVIGGILLVYWALRELQLPLLSATENGLLTSGTGSRRVPGGQGE